MAASPWSSRRPSARNRSWRSTTPTWSHWSTRSGPMRWPPATSTARDRCSPTPSSWRPTPARWRSPSCRRRRTIGWAPSASTPPRRSWPARLRPRERRWTWRSARRRGWWVASGWPMACAGPRGTTPPAACWAATASSTTRPSRRVAAARGRLRAGRDPGRGLSPRQRDAADLLGAWRRPLRHRSTPTRTRAYPYYSGFASRAAPGTATG